jgi:hypothetical protein
MRVSKPPTSLGAESHCSDDFAGWPIGSVDHGWYFNRKLSTLTLAWYQYANVLETAAITEFEHDEFQLNASLGPYPSRPPHADSTCRT